MTSVLDKYGIKEVADITFYEIQEDGSIGAPVLYFDTLKVSNIEQGAQQTTATGGKSNAPCIIWDYGKDIEVTLEDALFSMKSLSLALGAKYKDAIPKKIINVVVFKRNIQDEQDLFSELIHIYPSIDYKVLYGEEGSNPDYPLIAGKRYWIECSQIDFLLLNDISNEPVNDKYSSQLISTEKNKFLKSYSEIIINAEEYPKVYYITGDTCVINEDSGKTEFFQFIIPKGKIKLNETITLEADGEPSVFNIPIKVLRPSDGVMMKLVRHKLRED